MNNKIINLTDTNFEKQVLNFEGNIVVDFWSEFCGPCKIMEPLIKQIADEFKNKITFSKFNIEENLSTPKKYDIRSIPTILIFNNGKLKATKVGLMSKSNLRKFIIKNI
ncbi:MAG: thioredoxin [Candidatus Makana argininalis]